MIEAVAPARRRQASATCSGPRPVASATSRCVGTFDKVKDDPRVQEKAQQAADLAKEKAPVVKDKVTEAAGAATEQGEVGARSGSDDAGRQAEPGRAPSFQDRPGPQGDLP